MTHHVMDDATKYNVERLADVPLAILLAAIVRWLAFQ